MEQESKKVNKPMFWFGIVLMVVTAISLVVVEKDLGAWPMFMGILGIISISDWLAAVLKNKKGCILQGAALILRYHLAKNVFDGVQPGLGDPHQLSPNY